jgi:signal transduction histidine kinase
MLLTTAFGLGLLAVGAGLAVLFTRRITQPIGRLVLAARDIANGKPVDLSVDRRVVEIATLAEALQAASEGTRERERLARTFALRLQDDIDAERRRIARSFHDDLGQRLSVIAMMADIMRNSAADAEQSKLLESICDAVRGAVRSMRSIIADIRPRELDLGLDRGLAALLDEWTARSGVPHDLEVDGRFDDLPEPMQIALYRIAQEALNNIGKHASARNVHVAIRRTAAHVFLDVRDDGAGIDLEAANNKKGHFGLFGMRERAAQFDGTLRITGKPGAGTTLRVEMPWPHDVDAHARR